MSILINCSTGLDWSAIGSVAGGLGTLGTTFLVYRAIPKIRRDLADRGYLLRELTEVLHLHSLGTNELVDRSASGEAEKYEIRELRVGKHSGVFDRVVLEFAGRYTPRFEAQYTSPTRLASANVSGSEAFVIRFPGSAVEPPPVFAARRLSGGQVVDAKVTKVGTDVECIVGLRRKLPFLAFTLESPPRIVLDFPYD